ncbi:MAG TPA: hypothetical protein VF266_01915 [Thermoanaerobaculia bacterium]
MPFGVTAIFDGSHGNAFTMSRFAVSLTVSTRTLLRSARRIIIE